MWKQAQLKQWQKTNGENEHPVVEEEYSSGEEYTDVEEDDDDEYEPLAMSAWGTQAANGNPSAADVTAAWSTLIDPNVKIPTSGLGSGQLHRKGANFIPLSENTIVNQRLGKPIPKAVKGKKKKPKPKAAKTTFASRPPPPKSRYIAPPTFSPAPSTIANKSREEIKTGPWASGNLTSNPFWENKSHSSNSAPTSAASQPQFDKPSVLGQPNSQINKRPAVLGQQTPLPQQWSQQQTPPPQQWGQQQTPPPQQQPAPSRDTFDFNPNLGSATSKFAPFSVRQAAAQAAASVARTQAILQPQPPTITPPNPQPSNMPVINFNIELAAGVNAKLTVYENDDPLTIVNKFEKDHKLNISDEAKKVFAKKVQLLLEKEYKNRH